MSFKGIPYLELWRPFVRRSVTICVIYVEGFMRNNSVIFFLNLGQWFRRCSLKDFISVSLATLLFRSKTIYAILEEGVMGNIHVKLYEI